MMPNLPARLARKNCHYHSGLADDPEECLCGIFEEIAREALEEAEKVARQHPNAHAEPRDDRATGCASAIADEIAILRKT